MIEAMKQELDALENSIDDVRDCLNQNLPLAGYARYDQRIEWYREQIAKHEDAITSLRQAIEQAEKQEPVAWRTFDGEGGYDYRTYDMNEDYAKEWNERNPNHKGWVEPLYKDPTPCPTCEALARTVMMDQTAHDLYTTPQPKREWVGLTQEDIDTAFDDTQEGGGFNEFAREIEQTLRRKNT